MKLFPAKISEQETLQSQSVTLHCYARMLTEDRRLLRLGKHWDSRRKKLTFSLGTSHLLINVAFGISCGPAMLPQFQRGVRWNSITSWLISQRESAEWIVFDVEIKDDFFFSRFELFYNIPEAFNAINPFDQRLGPCRFRARTRTVYFVALSRPLNWQLRFSEVVIQLFQV